MIWLIALLAMPALADTPTDPDLDPVRARIGLVLSGGGARGGAHIGVLEVLEALRVPVDAVAGTSIGAVIGGLYAAGYSPAQLRQEIEGIDWVAVFDDDPPRKALSFRRKEDDFNFLTNLRLAFRKGRFFVPPGLVRGQKLETLLRILSLDENGSGQIERLRLPFRAVAADIETGAPVILARGALGRALRASMSIPGAFSPVEIDGSLLVDGASAMNLPVQVAQAMGVDVVIAVDISTPLRAVDALVSALNVTEQVVDFQTQQNQQKQIERLSKRDILLRPDLGNIGSAAFSRLPEAVDLGQRAAREAAVSLSRYAIAPKAYGAWQQQQRRPPVEPPVIRAIRIRNETTLATSFLAAQIETQIGAPLDTSTLRADLDRLFGTDAFEFVDFDLLWEEGGMTLEFHVAERLRGRNYFRLGLNLAADFSDDAVFNLALNHVLFPANAYAGEFRSQGQIGDTSGVATEFYQPLDPARRFFVSPFASYELRDRDVFMGQRRVAKFDLETVIAGLDVGIDFAPRAELRFGIGYLDGEANLETGSRTDFRDSHFSGGVLRGGFIYDQLDNVSFPNDGSFVFINGTVFRKELGWNDSVASVDGGALVFRTYARNTLGLSIAYGTSFDARSRPDLLFSKGGFFNLSGYAEGSLTAAHFGLARLLAYRRIVSPTILAWEFPMYLGISLEGGNVWEDRDDFGKDLRYSVAPYVGIETPIGPLYLAYAYGGDERHRGYLFLGRSF